MKDDKTKKQLCYHEAGHAVALFFFEIVPFTIKFHENGNATTYWKGDLTPTAELIVTMAGILAEIKSLPEKDKEEREDDIWFWQTHGWGEGIDMDKIHEIVDLQSKTQKGRYALIAKIEAMTLELINIPEVWEAIETTAKTLQRGTSVGHQWFWKHSEFPSAVHYRKWKMLIA